MAYNHLLERQRVSFLLDGLSARDNHVDLIFKWLGGQGYTNKHVLGRLSAWATANNVPKTLALTRIGLVFLTSVANGTFVDGGTNWTADATWSIEDETAIHAAGVAGNLSQLVTLVPGATYRVTYTVTVNIADVVFFSFQGGTPVVGTFRTAPGTYTEDVVAVTGNNALYFTAGAGSDAVLDNISVTRIG